MDLIHPAIDIVKTVNPDSGEPGDTVTYTYVVTNTGDTTLYNVSVDDDIIGHIGDIAELAPGESETLTKDWVLPVEPARRDQRGNRDGHRRARQDGVGQRRRESSRSSWPNNPPKEPPPTAFTGSDALRFGLVALALLALGMLALAFGRRRGRHEPPSTTRTERRRPGHRARAFAHVCGARLSRRRSWWTT